MNTVSAVTMSSLTSNNGTLFLSILVFAVIAVFGYRISERSHSLRGVTPWRIPSIVWGIICFMFSIFGIALEFIAIFSTRPVQNNAPALGNQQQAPYVPTTPDKAATIAAVAAYTPRIPASGYAGPQSDHLGKAAVFGWYHDVTNRHELRYFDGRDWTKYVADSGTTGEDPIV